MYLHYKKSGTGPPLVILHGLFGMLDNWQTIAKHLESRFTIYLIDQRNHGRSPHTEDHSYQLMAEDLYDFFQQQHINKAIIMGHSMGGKTAMQFAINHPSMIEKLIVVDMGIKRYPGGHDSIFDALQAFDTTAVTKRSEAEAMLSTTIPDAGVRQFVLKNLTRNPDASYQWKFNLPTLVKNYEENILAPITIEHPCNIPALFIRGENSNYIGDNDWPAIQLVFPAAELKTISNAGHWVHADQPEALLKEVLHFLQH